MELNPFQKPHLSQNLCKGLTQWYFVTFGLTRIYTTEEIPPTLTTKTWWLLLVSMLGLLQWTINLKKFVWLHWIQSINWWWQVESQNRNHQHGLPQTWVEIKSVCSVWIWPTGNLITQPRSISGFNELWSSKFNAHKSKINKRSLEQIT